MWDFSMEAVETPRESGKRAGEVHEGDEEVPEEDGPDP